MERRFKLVEGGCSKCNDAKYQQWIEQQEKWDATHFPYCLILVLSPEHGYNYEFAKITVKKGEYHEHCPLLTVEQVKEVIDETVPETP